MKFKIRSATAADVPAMHAVRARVRQNRLSDFTRITESSYLPYVAAGSAWVAETQAAVLGFAAIDAPAKRVWALFIDPDAERVGMGRALHEAMLEWASEQGIGQLRLSTEDGSRAKQFYCRAGWVQVEVTADGEVLFEKSLDA